MRKISSVILALAILFSLAGCSETSEVTNKSTSVEQEIVSEQKLEISPEKQAEEDAIAFFANFVDNTKNGKKVLGGRVIEDLAKAYPDNVLINNYNNFYTAYIYLDFYLSVTKSEEDYNKFEHYLSLVDISFDGEYSDFINEFVQEKMGLDRYNELRGTSVDQDKIYRNLTDSDKVDILKSVIEQEERYGSNISDEQYDKLLEEVATEYGITSNDILLIMLDGDLMQKAYSSTYKPANKEKTVEKYDATLVNDGYRVVIAANKAMLDEFLNALTKGNDSRINELLINANIAYVADGTKVDIIEDGIGVKKVRILDGNLVGVEAYTIAECVKNK